MVINGKKVGDPVNVNYTRENSGDVSGSGTTLIMSLNDNIHNGKLGQVIFIQDESGKTVVVTCRQGKKRTEGILVLSNYGLVLEFLKVMYFVMEVK